MRIKSTKMRPPVPRPPGEAKTAAPSSQKSLASAKSAHAPTFIRKKEKSGQGVLSQLMGQFSTIQCYLGSEQDAKLGSKAYSQKILPVLPQATQYETKVPVDPKSAIAKRDDKGHSRQGNLFHAETGDRKNRNRVYQSLHAEGRAEIRNQLGKLRILTGKVPDSSKQAVQRLDGMQRSVRANILDSQKHSRRVLRASGSQGIPA